ncbi:MAG: DUF2169 domain-containing protein [Planctomycetes bacterium]|nr:DUF2169 domain-containing protein [Planctomycetota bacterium]
MKYTAVLAFSICALAACRQPKVVDYDSEIDRIWDANFAAYAKPSEPVSQALIQVFSVRKELKREFGPREWRRTYEQVGASEMPTGGEFERVPETITQENVGYVYEWEIYDNVKDIQYALYQIVDKDGVSRGWINADEGDTYPNDIFSESVWEAPGRMMLPNACELCLGVSGPLSIVSHTAQFFKEDMARLEKEYQKELEVYLASIEEHGQDTELTLDHQPIRYRELEMKPPPSEEFAEFAYGDDGFLQNRPDPNSRRSNSQEE